MRMTIEALVVGAEGFAVSTLIGGSTGRFDGEARGLHMRPIGRCDVYSLDHQCLDDEDPPREGWITTDGLELRTLLLRLGARVVIVVASMLGAPLSAAADPVAMVTDITGSSTIVEDGKERRTEILRHLAVGSELRVAEGGVLTLVYYGSGVEYRFSGEAVVEIGMSAPKSVSGATPDQRELALVKATGLKPPSDGGYDQAAIVLRGNARKPKIRLIGPRNTRTLDAQPVFRWEPVEGDAQYRFVLMNESGRTVMETLVNATELKLPAEVRLDEESLYTWQIEARLASGAIFSSTADFSLLSQADRERIESLQPKEDAPFSERVMFAYLLEQLGLADDAAQAWQRLAAERPTDPSLKARGSLEP